MTKSRVILHKIRNLAATKSNAELLPSESACTRCGSHGVLCHRLLAVLARTHSHGSSPSARNIKRTNKPQLTNCTRERKAHLPAPVPALHLGKTRRTLVAPGGRAGLPDCRHPGIATIPGLPLSQDCRQRSASVHGALHCIHWNQQALHCDFWPLGIFLAICQGLPCDLLWRKQTQALTNENM